MNKRFIFIFIGIIVLGTIIKLVFFRPDKTPAQPLCNVDFNISSANPAASDFKTGDTLIYEDNTAGANTWQWNFGNKKSSITKKGKIVFDSARNYIISLTINGTCTKNDTIAVNAATVVIKTAAFEIIGPDEAHTGDKVKFTSSAEDAKTFEWHFGEHPDKVDSKEESPEYEYHKAGTYDITLKTDKGDNVVHKSITIKKSAAVESSSSGGGNAVKYTPPTDSKVKDWLSNIASTTATTNKDDDFINENFDVGPHTPVVWNGNATILSRVIDAFTFNPGNVVVSVTTTHDPSTKFITKLIVTSKMKN